MANQVQSKCLCCGEIFTVDVRNRGRQKYCSKRVCRAVGKATRQRRWLAKPANRNYFREPDNAARVREWQHAHPGYWRNTARYRRRTLQDAHRVQAIDLFTESTTVALQGSGASRDFGHVKTRWRIEGPQAENPKCLISSRFLSLTRVTRGASVTELGLSSADAPEP
jgi:hypothetical protein